MTGPALHISLRPRREQAGLTQQQLAARAGVSRQALNAIERGEAVPATSVALRLGQALGCAVEDLFRLSAPATTLSARPARDAGPAGDNAAGWRPGTRVALAQVNGRWVARAIDGEGLRALSVPADGVVERARPGSGATIAVQTLAAPEALAANLFVAGCDPALGLLAAQLERSPGAGRAHWTELGSGAALTALAEERASVVGVHLYDEATGEFNVGPVRRRLPGRRFRLVNLASWEHGLVVPAGNPGRVRGVADLGRKGVRLVEREAGTGSRELLRRLVGQAGLSHRQLQVVGVARGHLAIAQTIAAGMADAGVATRAAARAFGLGFIPLGEARFDLVVPQGRDDARVERLLDTLASGRFRRELQALPGYDARRCGEVIAEA